MSYTDAEVSAASAAMQKYRGGDEGEVAVALIVVGLSSERAAKEAQIRDDMIRVDVCLTAWCRVKHSVRLDGGVVCSAGRCAQFGDSRRRSDLGSGHRSGYATRSFSA